MLVSVSDLIYGIIAAMGEGDVIKKPKFKSMKIKKPRKNPAFKNKSNRSDYSKEYMQEYREDGKDYQKKPDAIKELRKENKKKLKEKFGL